MLVVFDIDQTLITYHIIKPDTEYYDSFHEIKLRLLGNVKEKQVIFIRSGLYDFRQTIFNRRYRSCIMDSWLEEWMNYVYENVLSKYKFQVYVAF